MAATQPSAAATTTCLYGVFRISPMAKTPLTLLEEEKERERRVVERRKTIASAHLKYFGLSAIASVEQIECLLQDRAAP